MQSLGIDLGTTNTVAAIGDHVFEIADEGGCTLPSVVAFPPNGRIVVGQAARRRRAIDSGNTIFSAKRILGRLWDDTSTIHFREHYPFQLVRDDDGTPLFETRAGRHSPSQISSLVLAHVLECVGPARGDLCVQITIPTGFSRAQQDATRTAAELAGLDDVRLLMEPVATAYAYLSRAHDFERAVVYDLGGGTFDCAVIEHSGDGPHMLAHAGDLMLGGDDIDHKLAEWVRRQVLEKHGWDLTTYWEGRDRLLRCCEEAKMALSQVEQAEVEVSQVDPECPIAGESVSISRRILDDLCSDLVRRSFVSCDAALRSAGLQPRDIDAVFLAGGTTALPMVQEGVRDYFGRPGLLEFDPKEVVARGASLAGPTPRSSAA